MAYIMQEKCLYVYERMFSKHNIQHHKIYRLDALFQNINYHFVNQHIYGNFIGFPIHKKIIYIGGIHVEEKGILIESKIGANDVCRL